MNKDSINHPQHYTRGRFETIDVIEDWRLGFCLGNAIKYISRAGHKDSSKEVEDLKKARWYLDRHIAQLEGCTLKPIDSLALVREFHEAFAQEIADSPRVTDDALNKLRLDLLREELDELADALAASDPVAALDALTDLQYVLNGAYLALGFHALKDDAFVEVHRSNMSKLGEDGKPVYRSDGKVLKGPSYQPPALGVLLESRFDLSDAEPAK